MQHLVREEWLDAIEALLYHVHDLPEDGLVKLIVFVLSSVSAEVGDHCCCGLQATGTVIDPRTVVVLDRTVGGHGAAMPSVSSRQA